MTGPNEPKVGNIPDHLDEYPPVIFYDQHGKAFTFARDEHGEWWTWTTDGPMSFEEWINGKRI